MDLLTRGVWFLAERLGCDPDVVLAWRETKFLLWLATANEHRRDAAMMRAALTSAAVWDPKSVPELLRRRPAKMTRKEIDRALERAEEISRMKMRETT